jgi:hypothetical protein
MTVARRSLTLAILVGVLSALAATDAVAAPIQLGENLATGTYASPASCNPNECTIVQLSVAEGRPLLSPVDGAIVSWSVKGASVLPGYKLRVLSRLGLQFTAVRSSAEEVPLGSGVETFPAALPISKGQYVGLDVPGGGNIGWNSGSTGKFWLAEPPLADGGSGTEAEASGSIAYSALVQPAPTVSSISQTSGPATGGTAVTITGTDLEGTYAVDFGPTPATAFTVEGEGQISVSSPSAAAGAVPISVTTVAGTASSARLFGYSTPPAQSVTTPAQPGATPTAAAVKRAICIVPALEGKKLKASRKKLGAADCRLGTVTRKKGAAKPAKVVRQSPRPGKHLAAGAAVKVTLG